MIGIEVLGLPRKREMNPHTLGREGWERLVLLHQMSVPTCTLAPRDFTHTMKRIPWGEG